MTARHGWSFVVTDCTGNVVAAAHGRPPHWADGIFGAELWGLHEATATSADLEDHFWVDCQSVQRGSTYGIAWASAPARKMARAWIPIASRLEGDTSRTSWMPAHTTETTRARRRRSDGKPLTDIDIVVNGRADELAKAIPRKEKPSLRDFKRIKEDAARVMEAAQWLGRVTARANRFPDPSGALDTAGRLKRLRDSQGLKGSQPRAVKKAEVAPPPRHASAYGDRSSCPRWAALRVRVLARAAGSAQKLLQEPGA